MKNPIHDINRSIVAEPVKRLILEIDTGAKNSSENSKVSHIRHVNYLNVCGLSQAVS